MSKVKQTEPEPEAVSSTDGSDAKEQEKAAEEPVDTKDEL